MLHVSTQEERNSDVLIQINTRFVATVHVLALSEPKAVIVLACSDLLSRPLSAFHAAPISEPHHRQPYKVRNTMLSDKCL